MEELEAFLEGCEDIGLRKMLHNGEYVFSVHGFINAISQNVNEGYGRGVFRRIASKHSAEISNMQVELKFPGQGQRGTPCMNVRNLERLLLLLPGDVSKRFRQQAETALTRIKAGDQKLINAINANAESSSAMSQACRESLEKNPQPGDNYLDEAINGQQDGVSAGGSGQRDAAGPRQDSTPATSSSPDSSPAARSSSPGGDNDKAEASESDEDDGTLVGESAAAGREQQQHRVSTSDSEALGENDSSVGGSEGDSCGGGGSAAAGGGSKQQQQRDSSESESDSDAAHRRGQRAPPRRGGAGLPPAEPPYSFCQVVGIVRGLSGHWHSGTTSAQRMTQATKELSRDHHRHRFLLQQRAEGDRSSELKLAVTKVWRSWRRATKGREEDDLRIYYNVAPIWGVLKVGRTASANCREQGAPAATYLGEETHAWSISIPLAQLRDDQDPDENCDPLSRTQLLCRLKNYEDLILRMLRPFRCNPVTKPGRYSATRKGDEVFYFYNYHAKNGPDAECILMLAQEVAHFVASRQWKDVHAELHKKSTDFTLDSLREFLHRPNMCGLSQNGLQDLENKEKAFASKWKYSERQKWKSLRELRTWATGPLATAISCLGFVNLAKCKAAQSSQSAGSSQTSQDSRGSSNSGLSRDHDVAGSARGGRGDRGRAGPRVLLGGGMRVASSAAEGGGLGEASCIPIPTAPAPVRSQRGRGRLEGEAGGVAASRVALGQGRKRHRKMPGATGTESGDGVGTEGDGALFDKGVESVWQADESPDDIALGPRAEEEERRREDMRRAKDRKKAKKNQELLKSLPQPCTGKPRIWWSEEKRWVSRLWLPLQKVPNWCTANIKNDLELREANNRDWTDQLALAGNKFIAGDAYYLRRTYGEGLGYFSDVAVDEGIIVAKYVGLPYCLLDPISRQSTGPGQGTHRMSLRHKASMPASMDGIDGAILHKPLPNGRAYDLAYYAYNGVASLANSRKKRQCNCKLVVEYLKYESGNMANLYVEDKYCPADIEARRRVRVLLVTTKAVPKGTQFTWDYPVDESSITSDFEEMDVDLVNSQDSAASAHPPLASGSGTCASGGGGGGGSSSVGGGRALGGDGVGSVVAVRGDRACESDFRANSDADEDGVSDEVASNFEGCDDDDCRLSWSNDAE